MIESSDKRAKTFCSNFSLTSFVDDVNISSVSWSRSVGSAFNRNLCTFMLKILKRLYKNVTFSLLSSELVNICLVIFRIELFKHFGKKVEIDYFF